MAEEEREGICGLLEISRISFNPYFQSFDQSTLLNADEEKKQSLHLRAARLPPSDSRSSSSAAASGREQWPPWRPAQCSAPTTTQHSSLESLYYFLLRHTLLAPLTFFHPTKIGHLGDMNYSRNGIQSTLNELK